MERKLIFFFAFLRKNSDGTDLVDWKNKISI